ncbi:hypothetical protein QVD17_35270 [Tagetes erecta]|uniref:Uncharacterized protein n=1 Tax=Tagetes erecta TaxID=13708 RepID=A0AAD8K1T8_TARER|nr:hypothetical protein QVD17_35270 [Tagetes erecta]
MIQKYILSIGFHLLHLVSNTKSRKSSLELSQNRSMMNMVVMRHLMYLTDLKHLLIRAPSSRGQRTLLPAPSIRGGRRGDGLISQPRLEASFC